MADSVDVKVSDLASRLVMRVNLRGMRAFRWRLLVARGLIRLAAWVAGCGVEINE